MAPSIEPYLAYSETGVSWLGTIPNHWRLLPGRACYLEKHAPNAGMVEDTVLSLSYGRVVVKPEEKLHGLVPASFETYQVIDPGDIVVRPTDLQNDWNSLRFALSAHRGIITSAYIALRTRDGLSSDFGYLLLHAYDLKKIFYGLGSGLRQNLDWRDFKYLPCPVPPLGEQATIVRYLDHMNRRIRRYIRSKHQLIGALEDEQRRFAYIAATRGLDPAARLEPSGVEWLGCMPEHWGHARLKFVASRIADCVHATPEYQDDGAYPAIRTADVHPGRLRLETARRVDDAHYQRWTERMAPTEGDILYTREGERFGIAAQVPAEVRLCISQRMMALRIHPIYNATYIMWQINCPHVYAQAAADVIGSAAPHVNVERVKNLRLTLPPRTEQDAIAATISSATAGINRAIGAALREIELVKAYRARLIADVVTGRLDVRKAVEQLPDDLDEPEPFDDPGALAEDAQAEGEGELDAALEEVEA